MSDPTFEQLIRDRDEWKDRALKAEAGLAIETFYPAMARKQYPYLKVVVTRTGWNPHLAHDVKGLTLCKNTVWEQPDSGVVYRFGATSICTWCQEAARIEVPALAQ